MNQEKQHKSNAETDAVSAKRQRTDHETDGVDCSSDGYESNISQQSEQFQKIEVPGLIEKIHLKNFMFHANLEVNLNPRINFIAGRNGDEKSAAITALNFALGGNVTATNIASLVKDFVMKGETTASVEVTINNKGVCAYKPEQYGNVIIVCRTLRVDSGESTYTIKSERGELKSSEKEELNRIVSHLNIQVNNPISVLNQDIARTFLNNSDPAENMTPQLPAEEDMYQNAIKNRDEAKRIYQQKRMAADALKSEMKDLKKRSDYYNLVVNRYKKKCSLKKELMWSLAIHEENLYKQLQNDLEAEIATSTNTKKEMEKCQSESEKFVDINRGLTIELSRVKQEEAKNFGKLNSAKERKRQLSQAASERNEMYIKKETLKKRLEGDIEILQQEIMEIKNINGIDYDAENKKKEKEIARLEQEYEQINARIKTADFNYYQLRSKTSSDMPCEKTLQAEKIKLLQQIESKNNEIRILETEDRGVISVYGLWMPTFLAKIDDFHREGRFDHKPVGPIGAYIKLKDSSWAPAIEKFLGAPFLSAFCVHSTKDLKVLRYLINILRIETPPDMLIGKFYDRVHDFQCYEVVAPGYTSLLGALIISNPVIANCVIDHRKAESVLLIPTNDEAHQLMSQHEIVPDNCECALTKTGDVYFPDSIYNPCVGSLPDRAKVLQVNMSDIIRNLKEELSAFEAKLKDVLLQLQSMNNTHHELKKISAVRNTLSRERLNISKVLSDLKCSAETEYMAILTLGKYLEDTNKSLNMVQEVCNKLKKEYEEYMAEVEESETVIQSLVEEYQQIISACSYLEEKISENENLIQNANMKLKTLQKNYKTHLAKVELMETDLKTQKQKCKTAVKTANEFGRRMVTNRSSDAINNELTNMEVYLRTLEEQEKRRNFRNRCECFQTGERI